jgi:glycogen debranching enzyme/putative sterol carrier protein
MSTNDSVNILEGDTFVVSDRSGDINASPGEPHGLFLQDTRFLSRWRLTVNGESPRTLSTDDVHYFSAQFFLVPAASGVYQDAPFSIIRKRSVGEGFHEDVTVLNHTAEPLVLDICIETAADFADLFEIKDKLAKKGRHFRSIKDGRLVLGYGREGFVRETWISASANEAKLEEDGIRFRVRIDPHDQWTTCLDVVASALAYESVPCTPKYGHGETRARPNMDVSLEEWIEAAPQLETDWRTLESTYERTLIDLAALRYHSPILPGMTLPAAGLPWFMTIFGRDSLLTSLQALPFTPELAETTLRVLAAAQGTRIDRFRDEEPGKILHELRLGELTAFEERPHSPYFGSADSTPLFLILLDATERWTGNAALVRELEPESRAALAWIDAYGDRDDDGYLEYERGNLETGLENQCWKDSWNSILFADGTMSSLPRACCEIQGYVYDAKLRCARLAREFWGDAELAQRLEREAADLKRRFNEDFWLADREYYALALDGEKRPVDSLTSNNGHLLWSGIVDDDKAAAVVRHLMGPRLWSGWGVRTMAEGDGGYNPVGYHNGTVWPHDNSFIAAGLARYGYREEAAQISFAMLEAAEFFRHRLPEVFAGYAREQTLFPVEYPTACSPQAWATGAPLLFMSTMLGLAPDIDADPLLPDGIGHLELTGGTRARSVEREGDLDARVPPVDSRLLKALGPDPRTTVSAREFFERAHEHFIPARTLGMRATFRFDISDVGSWRIVVHDGDVEIAEGREDADYVVEASEEVFMRILRGEQNATTAVLTGLVKVAGDLSLGPTLAKFMHLDHDLRSFTVGQRRA